MVALLDGPADRTGGWGSRQTPSDDQETKLAREQRGRLAGQRRRAVERREDEAFQETREFPHERSDEALSAWACADGRGRALICVRDRSVSWKWDKRDPDRGRRRSRARRFSTGNSRERRSASRRSGPPQPRPVSALLGEIAFTTIATTAKSGVRSASAPAERRTSTSRRRESSINPEAARGPCGYRNDGSTDTDRCRPSAGIRDLSRGTERISCSRAAGNGRVRTFLQEGGQVRRVDRSRNFLLMLGIPWMF
jgi:hypothetical protein